MILSIDLGTTNWKAALIAPDGQIAALSSMPTPMADENGHPCFDPHAMPAHLAALFAQFEPEALRQVTRIALTGMAEAGLMLDRSTRQPLSMIWPWFDRRALPLYEAQADQPLFCGRSSITGLPNSFKYGIYKLLTMLSMHPREPSSFLWCGLVSYAALLLTGQCAEDDTLAARTACLDIHRRCWDTAFLQALGLESSHFPRLVRSGAAVGVTLANKLGLPQGVPVCISGHDHVCAAHAAGALERGQCFLSTGTAQVMLRTTTQTEAASGLSYGPSPVGAPFTCLGSIQSAGGSINYWKKLLFPGESFDALIQEASACAPASLLYFPYLAGRGAPHLNPHARGALLGLEESTSRGQIIAAVYEGIAMETRCLLESMGFQPNESICCMGGLTRHEGYLHALADVTGATIAVPTASEGTLYGAARLACPTLPPLLSERCFEPNPCRHETLTTRYQQHFLPLMNLMQTEDSTWIK